MSQRYLSRVVSCVFTLTLVGMVVALSQAGAIEEGTVPAAPRAKTRAMAPEEARRAVAMLDDAYHLILEETHATYHRNPKQPVAATVVRKVQARMAEFGWPRSRFLAVNAVVMHPDHVPRDAFERRAVQTLRGDDQRVEQVVDGQLRVASVMSTGGMCASCHWTPPGQQSKAAISFSVPLLPRGGKR